MEQNGEFHKNLKGIPLGPILISDIVLNVSFFSGYSRHFQGMVISNSGFCMWIVCYYVFSVIFTI